MLNVKYIDLFTGGIAELTKRGDFLGEIILTATLSQYWSKIQETLFPQLEEQLDPLTEKQ